MRMRMRQTTTNTTSMRMMMMQTWKEEPVTVGIAWIEEIGKRKRENGPPAETKPDCDSIDQRKADKVVVVVFVVVVGVVIKNRTCRTDP